MAYSQEAQTKLKLLILAPHNMKKLNKRPARQVPANFKNNVKKKTDSNLQANMPSFRPLFLLLAVLAYAGQVHTYSICSGEGIMSPINVASPWKYESTFFQL